MSLNAPMDYYIYTVDIVNDGTIDGMIKDINKSQLSAQQEKYFEYSITYMNNVELQQKQSLKHNSSETIKVVIKYRDDVEANDLPQESQNLNLTFSIEYEQADKTATLRDTSFIKVVSRSESNKIQTGDKLQIANEGFYVVTSDENETVMLTEYCLNVGANRNYQAPEGIQDVSTTVSGIFYGSVPFSEKNYWYDTTLNIILSKYGTFDDYNNDIYDDAYSDASGDNYSIAYYVVNYVDYLKLNGAKNVSGRLLTYNEATSVLGVQKTMGNISRNDVEPWVYACSYWLGTVSDPRGLWRISNAPNFYDDYHKHSSFRVRPVIIVRTQDIEDNDL